MARKFSATFEVCTCKHVTLGEIVYAIKERSAKNLDDLARITDAGSMCESCICKSKDIRSVKKDLYLDEIIEKLVKN